jgi:hypothetical protein
LGIPGAFGGAEEDIRKQFFFEKKNQKTFDYKVPALPQRAPYGQKFLDPMSIEGSPNLRVLVGWVSEALPIDASASSHLF